MNARIIRPLDPEAAGPVPGTNHATILLERGDLDGRISLVEIIATRGNEPPLHRHQRDDLLIHVLNGELTFRIDGERFPVSPGSGLLIPRGSEYGYAVSSEMAHLLISVTPAGAEGYLVQLYDPNAAPGEGTYESLERLVTSAAQYGIDITGPVPADTVFVRAADVRRPDCSVNRCSRSGSRCTRQSSAPERTKGCGDVLPLVNRGISGNRCTLGFRAGICSRHGAVKRCACSGATREQPVW